MNARKVFALLTAAMIVGACGSAATPAPTAAPTAGPTAAPTAAATSTATAAATAAPTPAGPTANPWGFTPVYQNGVLQPLADGFPNKPITLVNGDDPGSDDGIYIRQMQALLKNVSPVPIEVLDKPGPQFGMWTMTELMNRTQAGKDGYEPSVAAFTGGALDLVTSPVTRDLNLTIADVNPVIATEKVPFVIATRADAPWKTYDEMVTYAKANPGKLKYLVRVGGQLDIAMSRLMASQGWTADRIPGGSVPEIATSLGAGAGDFGVLLPGTALPHVQTGKIRVLMVIGDNPATAPWADAENTKSIGLPGEPWGSIRGFIVPTATPDLHREWLAELFRNAAKTADYAKRTDTLPGLQIVDYNHADLITIMKNAIDFGTPVIRELKLAWDQQ